MYSIKEIRTKLESRQVSCAELTRSFLKKAEEENPTINAYITITPQEALAAAARVDERIKKGEKLRPLEGIPFVLKDNICTTGIRTTCASKMLENYVPIYDGTVWTLLKQQGAVMIGKGNMDEFAMGSMNATSYFGTVKNPHNHGRVAGGSSGGVAAAVAAGQAIYGIGSDTGGSIREPASFCGVVGLKPTYGAVSRRGLVAFASSLDQIGPITSCVEDAALVFDAICQKDELDMTSKGARPVAAALCPNMRGKRIGIAPQYFEGLNEDVAAALCEAKRVYADLGAQFVEVDFPSLKYSLPTYYILACAEASSNLGRYDGLRYGHHAQTYRNLDDMIRKTRSEGFGPEVRRRILLGTYVLSAGYYDAYYNKAQQLKKQIAAEFGEAFKQCDYVLTPTVPVTTPKHDSGLSNVQTYYMDICTVSVNIAGLPAVSIPCGADREGMPIGLQLIGASFAEKDILSGALAFENATERRWIRTPKERTK